MGTLRRMGASSDDRYGYWFPLVLLGFGLLALLGWEAVRVEGFEWVSYRPETTTGYQFYATLTGMEMSEDIVPLVIGAAPGPWTVLVTVCLGGTAAWYATRPWWRSVAVAAGGSAAIWLSYATDGLGELGLPLLVLGALAGAYFRLSRRRAAAVAGIVSLGAGGALMLDSWLFEPVLVGGGLLALAWFERSRLVAVVGCLVAAALLAFPDGMPRVLVPAMVVLGAAVVALVRRAPA